MNNVRAAQHNQFGFQENARLSGGRGELFYKDLLYFVHMWRNTTVGQDSEVERVDVLKNVLSNVERG